MTHCVMRWTVVTVLSLCLPVWSDLKVTQPPKVVSTNGTAQIQCIIQTQPSHDYSSTQPDLEDLRVTLLKGLHGTREVCSSTLNVSEQRETHMEQEGEVQCSAQARDGAVEVTVTGLKATDTDVYHCEIHILYPPPYLRLTGSGTVVHVQDITACPLQGAHRHTSHQAEQHEDDGSDERAAPVSVPVVVLVILVICVFTIILYFQSVSCQQQRRKKLRLTHMLQVEAVQFSCENVA